ncbi:ABC transporter ATP-binding protein [Halopenitus persicus]|uniref:Energy-coupling factor transport system ATP-binding protein n=1 Tax=Halopenitus persicus TaxID=1048396 RepID=A0A1H3J2G2_9EURY|nr:energy-coupling factor transporter ATPase [Halopenitus persicus]SDY33997.1 energy-coupling factor transport system ATP-binding protein [Halopenitus persicus]
MTDEEDGIAARLRNVVFSYDRDETLPDPETLDTTDVDPDDREGPVLRGVDLDVPAGSFTVVMGASGGGKSTLLRTLNAIIPDFITGSFDGEVDVLERDVTATRVSEMATDVGMLLQDYEAQLFGTSVAAEVAFGPENLAVPPAEIDDRIDDTLRLAGLESLDRRREPSGLSGGQKQRLVFAGVAAMHPRLLVLDEPTSDLDPSGTRELLSAIGSLAGANLDRSPGASETAVAADADWDGPETIVMVTHKIEEALLADHAVLLQGGTVYREGPAREVFTDVESLRESRVAIPPLVEAFDRLDVPNEDLPLIPEEVPAAAADHGLTWTPPARADGEPSTSGSAGTTDAPSAAGPADAPGAPADTGTDLGDPIFELEDVVFEYETDRGPVRAVDGISLTVREGEVLALVGHNGSGKTTLAKHLNGLHEPDAGSVRYDGREVADYSMAGIGRDVGYVFQNPDHQIFADTVREEVAFGPENFGLEGEELDRRVREALETVELDGLEEADPFAFSKGQRQRVALAGILATDPEVIVFDEPTTGLDATQQERFMQLVAKLNREESVTVVMVTHSMDTVARYAPRTAVLKHGRVVFDSSTRELFADADLLADNDLQPPHVVEASHELASAAGIDDALPALSIDELVAGLETGTAANGKETATDAATETATDAATDPEVDR